MEANPNRVSVPLKEFAAKASTKGDCYHLMSQDLKAYLPPKDTVTAWHLRDLATGAKAHLHCNNLRHIDVPFYHEELSTSKILAWAVINHRQVLERYFPPEREVEKLPR
jgi:hypothetical protein